MKKPRHLKRPPWHKYLFILAILGVPCLVYWAWSPGECIRDGRHDRGTNGIWIQHGWIGSDQWFKQYNKDRTRFRDDQKIQELADLFAAHGIKYVFPHLCPSHDNGDIASVDPDQTERFLEHFRDFAVIPWIGGVLGVHCFPESVEWQRNFVSFAVDLLESHPRLSGVQINIEPMPTGNSGFLDLLEELRKAMPEGKALSVAAYPPPTWWHRFPDVHWDEPYFRQVAERVNQMVPMMYDTAIPLQRIYQHLMCTWTMDILNWSGDTQVLLGVPAYDDAGVLYHSPRVENLRNALLGIHEGLSRFKSLSGNYAGIAIYSEWEMDEQEWRYFKRNFAKAP